VKTLTAAEIFSEIPLTPAANNTIRVDTPLVADIGRLSRVETDDVMPESPPSPSLSQQSLQERSEQAAVVTIITDKRSLDAEDVSSTNTGDADDIGHLSGIVIPGRDEKGGCFDKESTPSAATSKEPRSVDYTQDKGATTAVIWSALDDHDAPNSDCNAADMNLDALIEDPVGSFLLRCGLFHHRQGIWRVAVIFDFLVCCRLCHNVNEDNTITNSLSHLNIEC